MKWGLVELCVDVTGLRAGRATEAVRQGITRDPDRRSAVVRAALERARALACGFVVFPGWTLVALTPPRWLLDLTAGITVVVEMLLPSPASTATAPRKGARVPAPHVEKGRRTVTNSERQAWATWDGDVLRDGVAVVGPCAQFIAEAPELWNGNELSSAGWGWFRLSPRVGRADGDGKNRTPVRRCSCCAARRT